MIIFKFLLIIVMVFPVMFLGSKLLANLLDVFSEYRDNPKRGSQE